VQCHTPHTPLCRPQATVWLPRPCIPLTPELLLPALAALLLLQNPEEVLHL
jgi:hypothetical protein